MSKFNRGDRVRWTEDATPGRVWVVAAESTFVEGLYLVEWRDDDAGIVSPFCGLAMGESLRNVIDPPAPTTPWHRFTSNGTFTGRHKTITDALEHVTDDQFILHITTGNWYDHQGEAIA